MIDDEIPAIAGMIVFDSKFVSFYGVRFSMPKSVYEENKEIIVKVLQSIVIEEAQ